MLGHSFIHSFCRHELSTRRQDTGSGLCPARQESPPSGGVGVVAETTQSPGSREAVTKPGKDVKGSSTPPEEKDTDGSCLSSHVPG